MAACKIKVADKEETTNEIGTAVVVNQYRFPDQREHLKAFKDDIVIMKCEDYDFNTAPIGIGNKFFTLLRGWVYTDGVLSHTITSEGLDRGYLGARLPQL